MKKIFLYSVLLLAFVQCKKAEQSPENNAVKTDSSATKSTEALENGFIAVGDSVEIPKFRLEVNLSDDAVKKLNDKKESFIVSFYFYGLPKDSAQLTEVAKKNLDITGIRLLKKDTEIRDVKQTNEIDFSGLKIPKNLYDALADKSVSININIFSGRRAFEDNILDMEFYDGPFNDITKHSGFINLNGKLLQP